VDQIGLLGKQTIVRAAVAVAILAASGAGVWTAVHFGKPPAEKQPVALNQPEPEPEPPEPRLIGIWLTDSNATIAEVRTTRWISESDELKMRREPITVITFTATTVTMRPYSVTKPQHYEIINKGGDQIVLKTWFEATKKDDEFPIRFDGNDVFWFEAKMPSADGKMVSIKECFRRIKLDAAPSKYVPAAVRHEE
jgi:hypothetical protein